MNNEDKRQRAKELEWLKGHRPSGKIQGVNPLDRHRASGIIPIPPSVYQPAGGVRQLRKGLLRDGDTGLLKGDDK